ncbi:MAG: PAS domain S-box protein, partial [Chromatiales bacterium]|nr:PAS domain S-box protein [Chromatiales bacterium]
HFKGEVAILTQRGMRWHSLHCLLTEDPTSDKNIILSNEQDSTDAHLATERYRDLFIGNRAVMLLIDPTDGQIIDANQTASNFYGYSRDQLKGLKISDINILSKEDVQAEMTRAQNEKRSKFFFKHRTANGEIRDVEVHSGPVHADNQLLLYSIIHDITEQRAAEKALAKSEKRHRYIIDNTPTGFWLISAEKKTESVNRALCEMIGYQPEEMAGKLPYEFVDEKNAAIFRHQISLTSIVPHRNYEITLRHKQGYNVPTHFNATTMYDDDGVYQGSFAFVIDLTQLKQAEAARRQSDKVMQTAFNHAVNGMTMTNTDGSFFRVNPAFCSMLGYSEEELLTLSVADITHPDDLESSMKGIRRMLSGEIPSLYLEKRFLRKDGDIVWGAVNAAVIRDEQKRPINSIAQIEDITERRKAAETIEKLSRAVEHSGNSVMITDTDGVIEYVNPQFIRVTGYNIDEAIGKTPALMKSGHNHDDIYAKLWSTIQSGSEWRGELLNRNKDGSLYWTLLSISPIKNDLGEITHFIGVSEDITALKEAHAKAEHLSLYDSLTELANRRLFIDRLQQVVESSKRDNHQTAVMYLDLDRFKNINDALGHDAGDRVLKTVAQRLLGCVRHQDTVARLGGDEFAILIPHIDGIHGARSIARKIINVLSRSMEMPDFQGAITTSIGITLAPDNATEPEELMKNADLALYSAKAKGRNNFQFFTEQMNAEVSRRLTVEHELLAAMEQDHLQLYYQPVVCLEDNHIVGVEALLRWNHPDKGLLYPDSFIQIAEETGLINRLGEWVITTACRDLQYMAAEAFQIDWVSINISARQFQHPDFLNRTQKILSQFCSSPDRFKLELTESALMENTHHAIKSLNRLKDMGIGLSIDDFGTGYSSLAYLKRFPVDTLKVDRSFVMDIPADSNDMEITAAIIAMANKLNLNVIAEGIETEQQLEFLRTNDCCLGQGYLFGKPMPLKQLMTLKSAKHGKTVTR